MTMKTFAIAVLACLAVACGSSSEEEDVGSKPQSLVETCSGTYYCHDKNHTTHEPAVRVGDDCKIGLMTFAKDGTFNHGHSNWTGDASKFEACHMYFGEMVCTQCEVEGGSSGAPAPSSSGGDRCKGSASSCGSFVPGTCSGQTGCYMHSDYISTGSYGGYWQNDCRGSAARCGLFDSESSCKRQGGCYWQ
jgi:hypothetical protein